MTSTSQPLFDIAAMLRVAREQARGGGGTVLDVLLKAPGAEPTRMATALLEQAGVGMVVDGEAFAPDFSQVDKGLARQWQCVVVRDSSGQVCLAAADPWDTALLQKAARKLGKQPAVLAVSQMLLRSWLGENAPADIAGVASSDGVTASGPVVSFVNQALRGAYDGGASDVHFEADRHGMTAKHRLDGVLRTFARMEGVQAAQEVISRIKVMAQLDITERRLPQDGRCRFEADGSDVDLRVSIMPSVHGEDAVLRILDKGRLKHPGEGLTLESLGFKAPALDTIRELAYLPSGMLLITGPTGSGKTTTVYAALSEINTGQEKIITIEDPVEYELSGVLQIPVNERKGLTFARGLRSILRHDPDRILVGEIRDAETAEIAVQSALTGHLVFTTVHANSVADVVGRFRHFGLDMFGFMSSLNGVVVQRLVRRLCPHCATWREATDVEQRWLVQHGQVARAQVPAAAGCDRCQLTGFQGRFVVAEVHVVDDVLRDRVTEGASMSAIRAHAGEQQVESLLSISARAVGEASTTIEEIRRVVGWS